MFTYAQNAPHQIRHKFQILLSKSRRHTTKQNTLEKRTKNMFSVHAYIVHLMKSKIMITAAVKLREKNQRQEKIAQTNYQGNADQEIVRFFPFVLVDVRHHKTTHKKQSVCVCRQKIRISRYFSLSTVRVQFALLVVDYYLFEMSISELHKSL